MTLFPIFSFIFPMSPQNTSFPHISLELESRERNQHNLETTYVKDLLPGFKEEFKAFAYN